MRGLNIMVGDANSNVRKEMEAALYQRLGHDLLFRGHPFRRGDDQSPSLKRMADRSGLAGIMQEHIEATVCAGHSSPRRFRRSDSPVGSISGAALLRELN
jgi:hypothetical protein